MHYSELRLRVEDDHGNTTEFSINYFYPENFWRLTEENKLKHLSASWKGQHVPKKIVGFSYPEPKWVYLPVE